jgi:hypothetical protein
MILVGWVQRSGDSYRRLWRVESTMVSDWLLLIFLCGVPLESRLHTGFLH